MLSSVLASVLVVAVDVSAAVVVTGHSGNGSLEVRVYVSWCDEEPKKSNRSAM